MAEDGRATASQMTAMAQKYGQSARVAWKIGIDSATISLSWTDSCIRKTVTTENGGCKQEKINPLERNDEKIKMSPTFYLKRESEEFDLQTVGLRRRDRHANDSDQRNNQILGQKFAPLKEKLKEEKMKQPDTSSTEEKWSRADNEETHLLKMIYPELTHEQVMDLISGTGDVAMAAENMEKSNISLQSTDKMKIE